MDKHKQLSTSPILCVSILINVTTAWVTLVQSLVSISLNFVVMWPVLHEGQTLRHECDVTCRQNTLGFSFDKKRSLKHILQPYTILNTHWCIFKDKL